MPDFTKRSHALELLDDPEIPFPDIQQNMYELNVINKYLGGHRITLKGFQKLLGNKKQVAVCEIGCGGGDNLFVIYKWCRKNDINVKLFGIDINQSCIDFAKNQYGKYNIEFICSDFKKAQLRSSPDIIFNSLFCHHFDDAALINMMEWMKANSKTGFFINDLHRNAIAYYSIKMLTQFFSKSYLVKNDAPLSVLRGFSKKDWLALIRQSALNNVTIKWQWAFRHLIVYKK